MKYASLDIRIEGNKFYPSKLRDKTGLPIKVLVDFGDISPKGRFKGQASPYGIGILEVSESESFNNISDLFQEYTDKLLQYNNVLKECGAEDIIFDIESSKETPPEISLSQHIVKNLSDLNARVEFHVVDDEENLRSKIAKVKQKHPDTDTETLYKNVLNSLSRHTIIHELHGLNYFIYLYLTEENPGIVERDLVKLEKFYKEAI